MNDHNISFLQKNWKWNQNIMSGLFNNHSEIIESEIIKRNPLRTVFFIKFENDREFFVKYDHPVDLLKKFRIAFKNKIREEYNSAKKVESNGIPIVDYLGWGRNGWEAILVSRAVENSVNGKEYWHRFSSSLQAVRNKFLADLSCFIRRFIDSKLYHPDFHPGNILVERESGNILLVDPYGVKKIRRWSFRQLVDMCKIFVDFRGEISLDEALELLVNSGIAASTEKAEIFWETAVKAEHDEIVHGWEKRRKQILSGHSKFCTKIGGETGEKIFIRHSLWYTPMFDTDNFKLPDNLDAVELNNKDAVRIWLDSFRKQLFREKQEKLPLIWRHSGNNSVLYYSQ